MAKKTQITDDKRQTFAALAADGLSNIKIAEKMALTRYTVKKLREDRYIGVVILAQLFHRVAGKRHLLCDLDIAEKMALTRYTVKKLREDHDTNVAIDRVRLTETMPRQLSALIDVVTDLAQTVASLRNDVCDVNVTQKKVAKAMSRLQVENKNLREERRKAREDVRRLKAELWKARGY